MQNKQSLLLRNQIPKNWQKVRLGDNALLNPTVILGKGNFPYIPMEDLDWNKKYIYEKTIKEFKGGAKFEDGDVLFARITPCLENGKIGRVRKLTDGKGFGSTEYFVIRGKERVTDTDFLYYLCRTNNLRQTARNSMVGASGRQRANIESLQNYELYLPDYSEQKRIASVLSSFDDKIEVNNKIAKTLEEMAQALFKEWFVHFRFPGYEKVKFVESELGKIPKGWGIKSFGKVATNFDRKRKPLSSMERLNKKGSYPYFGATEIMDYINEYIFDGEYLLIAEDGTVETNVGKAVLQFIEGKFWVNNHAHIIQGADGIPTFYLYLVFKNISIKPYITGAVQLKLTQENLNKIPVMVSSQEIMKQFTDLVYPMILKIRKCNEENQKLAALRDLLLPKLMKGEISVIN